MKWGKKNPPKSYSCENNIEKTQHEVIFPLLFITRYTIWKLE